MRPFDQPSRITSGFIAGMSAILALLAMSLNIGGLDNFTTIVRGFWILFAMVGLLAFGLGLLLYKLRSRWSAAVGAAAGLLGGFLIVISVVSRI